jgi:hypothetical protein
MNSTKLTEEEFYQLIQPGKVARLSRGKKGVNLQQTSPGFPHLEASERRANVAQVGEEWRDGGSMEPSNTMFASYDLC